MISDIIHGVRSRKQNFIAKAISLIENNSPKSESLLSELYMDTGHSYRIGITGPPGAGKSSIANKLIQSLRNHNKTVAVLGIDPTSPFSGGALLGDRIRMMDHYNDQDVYIRSMASRGDHGGLAQATQEVGDILDAAGYDIILYETVGVGQVELDVIQACDTVIVVLVPESGDDIQMMKAGLMEIADIFAINKSDRPSSDKLCLSVNNMLSGIPHNEQSWIPRVINTVALTGEGIEDLTKSINDHKNHIKKTGIWKQKMDERYIHQVKELISRKQYDKFWQNHSQSILKEELNLPLKKRKSPQKLSEALYESNQ